MRLERVGLYDKKHENLETKTFRISDLLSLGGNSKKIMWYKLKDKFNF